MGPKRSRAASSGTSRQLLETQKKARQGLQKRPSAASNQPPAPKSTISSEPQLMNPGGSERRKVLVVYAGGTIGMQELPNGSLAPVKGALSQRLQKMEELDQKRMPQCFVTEFDPLLDSADMNPADWTAIAQAIYDAYYAYDGFVVLHGTDTLAYTASALSFMLEQLAKPVVLTGSMLPFFEPLSDARQNFLGAVVFAGLADISEVCVFFGGDLYRGNRTVKINATSLGAFGSPSYPPLAELGADIHIFWRRLREPPRGRFRLQQILVTEIIVVWVIPGFSDDFLEPLSKSNCIKGMVMMLYGCGTAPARKQTFLDKLRNLNDSGVVIVACSQCSKGNVALEKYKVGLAFQDAGVVSCGDMSTEATVTKLSYLLSKGLSPDQCRKHMGEDLRGEISTDVNTFKIHEPVTGLSTL